GFPDGSTHANMGQKVVAFDLHMETTPINHYKLLTPYTSLIFTLEKQKCQKQFLPYAWDGGARIHVNASYEQMSASYDRYCLGEITKCSTSVHRVMAQGLTAKQIREYIMVWDSFHPGAIRLHGGQGTLQPVIVLRDNMVSQYTVVTSTIS